MKTVKDLVKIYTGPEESAILLSAKLEKIGVFTLSSSGVTNVFASSQSTISLLINDDDLDKAKPIIDDFTSSQEE